ncbi:Endochitinase 46 [Diplonema papillatum]|nr:Endochitinase 46 [Diplonema papillatum]
MKISSASTLVLVSVALLCAPLGAQADRRPENEDVKIFGYLPEWRYLQWTPDEVDNRWRTLCRHLTHIILFSLEVSPTGEIVALDRFPNPHIMHHAQEGHEAYGCKLMISFGGNGRTNGFPHMAANKDLRSFFVHNLRELIERHGLHGVDFNWEYPRTPDDWENLFLLVRDTRHMLGPEKVVTVAYYPDGDQERELAHQRGKEGETESVVDFADYFLMMAYDQGGRHSTMAFAERAIERGVQQKLPSAKMALGVPFYSRNMRTADWKSYADLWKEHHSLDPREDEMRDDYYNGQRTLGDKVHMAASRGVRAIMIWEVGQDLFDEGQDLHQASLLRAISKAVETVPAPHPPGHDEL